MSLATVFPEASASVVAAVPLPPTAFPKARIAVRSGVGFDNIDTVGWGARNIPACAACHGKALTGVAPAIPGLLGLPRDYISAQLGAWQTGQRRAHAPDCMARIAGLLDAQDINAVAGWLSAQPVPAGARAAAPLAAPLVMDCGSIEASTR